MADLTAAQIKQAFQVESLQEKLHALFGGHASATKSGRPTGKRTISAEHRAALAAAQKARWAAKKAATAQ